MATDDKKMTGGATSARFEELLKTHQDVSGISSQRVKEANSSLASAAAKVDELTRATLAALNKEAASKHSTALVAALTRKQQLEQELAAATELHNAGLQKMLSGGMRKMLSASTLSSDISAGSRSIGNIVPAIKMAMDSTTGQLQNDQQRMTLQLQGAADRARSIDVSAPGGMDKAKAAMADVDRQKREIEIVVAAMGQQKKMGTDTGSIMDRGREYTSRATADLAARNLRDDVSAGKYTNKKKAEEELASITHQLAAALKDFQLSTDAATEANYKNLEQKHREKDAIVREMNRQGIGGAGGGGTAATVASALQGASLVTGIAANVYRYGMITSEMEKTQNRIGFASLANQRFQDNYAAGRGDMAALRRVMDDQYSMEVRLGHRMGNRESKAKFMEASGQGIGVAGSLVIAGTQIAGGDVGGGINTALGAGPEIQNTATATINYEKRISQGQALLARAAQIRELKDTVNQISDFSSQKAFDYQKSITFATRGLGIGGVSDTSYNSLRTLRGGYRSFGGGSADQSTEDFIKGHEGVSLNGYGDTSRGYSIGYGHFVEGTSQKGKKITQAQADAYFKADMASHSNVVDTMLGPDVMNKLSSGQKTALYDLSYNSNANKTFRYGGNNSIYNRLKRGDITGAGEQLLTTATSTADGPSTELEQRRRDEYAAYTSNKASRTSTNLGTSIAGGGDRETAQTEAVDKAFIRRMAMAGLGGEDVPGLIGMGRSTLGKEFLKGGMGNNLERAGQLAQIGYMESPQQYLQARGQMSGAGGTGQDLEEILKNAVANGMDSSKNIMEMVNATTSLASRSAQMGINAFGGAAEMIGKGLDAAHAAGISPNMATAAAQNAAEDVNATSSSSTLNLPNVIEMQKLRQQFPKATLQELMSLQGASFDKLATLKQKFASGDKAGARQMTIQMGLLGQINSAGDVDNLIADKREKNINTDVGFGIDEVRRKRVLADMQAGRKLSDSDRSFFNGLNGLRGQSGDLIGGILDNVPVSKGGLKQAAGGNVGSGEGTIAADAVTQAKVLAAGMDKFQKALGGYEVLGNTMMKVAEMLKPHQDAAASAKAANDFKLPEHQFGTSVLKFDTAVTRLLNGLGGKSQSGGLDKNVNHKQSRSGHTQTHTPGSAPGANSG